MKTIRLLYPDYLAGGMDTYYFGANLLTHILPVNENQPLLKVDIIPPDGREHSVVDGIYAKEQVIDGIKQAEKIIEDAKPDKIITIGGNCLVSQAPFDYLHGLYDKVGIIWIDAHPDVSTVKDGYPNAHAMVLGALLGQGDKSLMQLMKNKPFKANQILYVGLQPIHDYQEKFLKDAKVDYMIQDKEFISENAIQKFMDQFDHIMVHFDIDVLDENLFHSTYFANKDLVGDGSSGGKMSMEQLSKILTFISSNTDVVGFTIAEYLPFDEYNLHKMLSKLDLFTK